MSKSRENIPVKTCVRWNYHLVYSNPRNIILFIISVYNIIECVSENIQINTVLKVCTCHGMSYLKRFMHINKALENFSTKN